MGTVLFEAGDHRCVVFNDLVRGEDGVQANQFLVQHGGRSALIDPGGALLYNPLTLALVRYVQPDELNLILFSHQDPDIIGAADKWLLYTRATMVVSALWGRFVPHLVPHYLGVNQPERYLLLPDRGGEIPLGDGHVRALPAHFMHSVGNFSFFDPISRILFSGDVGASMVPSGEPYVFVQDFAAHMPRMAGFHRRYMASRRVTRLWCDMVRQLDPAMIVPQHGLPLRGAQIGEFLDWLSGLECGVDLLSAADYAL